MFFDRCNILFISHFIILCILKFLKICRFSKYAGDLMDNCLNMQKFGRRFDQNCIDTSIGVFEFEVRVNKISL